VPVGQLECDIQEKIKICNNTEVGGWLGGWVGGLCWCRKWWGLLWKAPPWRCLLMLMHPSLLLNIGSCLCTSNQ
jgi:hypothetical protein